MIVPTGLKPSAHAGFPNHNSRPSYAMWRQSILIEIAGASPLPDPPGEARGSGPYDAARHPIQRKLRVLVACEYSATVRDAFRARGHDAWSCDLLPTEGDPRWHIEGDAIQAAHGQHWDLMIAHPPCTHLAVSGARHFAAKRADGRQAEALEFIRRLLAAPIPHIALENPVSIISSAIRKPDQIIQPWQFGHGETKATCLWLKGLPPLVPTDVVAGREARIHRMAPSPTRWKERSRTYQGIADAMADQWPAHVVQTFPCALAGVDAQGATGGGAIPVSPAADHFAMSSPVSNGGVRLHAEGDSA